MLGYFDQSDGNPKVVIEISGARKDYKKQVSALFDTGHSGSLSLPILDLIDIGAQLSNVGEAELANGYPTPVLYFSVTVIVDGIPKQVQASMIDNPKSTEAICGLELFSHYVALVDFKGRELKFSKVKEEEEKE